MEPEEVVGQSPQAGAGWDDGVLVPEGPGSLADRGAGTISWAWASVLLVLSCPPLPTPVLELSPALQSQPMLWNGGAVAG